MNYQAVRWADRCVVVSNVRARDGEVTGIIK